MLLHAVAVIAFAMKFSNAEVHTKILLSLLSLVTRSLKQSIIR